MSPDDTVSEAGPVVFAYDGSELANLAIEKASRLFGDGREALVVCVWQPFDVGFELPAGAAIDTARIPDVKDLAQETADLGAARAEAMGFRARGLEIERSPIWKGITEVAEEHDACLIVLGSHGRAGLTSHLVGSVAKDVAAHSKRSVLITHRHP